MPNKRLWSFVEVNNKCFIYGPRFGSLYVIDSGSDIKHLLYKILGLGKFQYTKTLSDPAISILFDGTHFKGKEVFPVKKLWKTVYRIIHHSKTVIPYGFLLRLVILIGNLKGRSNLSLSQIAQKIHAIEKKAELSDCYPRSLITAYLCTRGKISIDVTIGVLAPTRMMHAWCSAEGILPYEPFPEHYMYQPLITF